MPSMRAIALMLGMLGLFLGMIGGLFGLRAQAGEAPAIVIPSRPGVPVIINGGDASYCVVEGDVGLARPGLRVTVVACPPHHPIPSYEGSYFPAFGRRPGYGRLEVEPPSDRELPKPAESYYRQWDSQSAPVPASGGEAPADVDITVLPQVDPRRRRLRRQDR
jgi:hypothetical protein